MLSRIKIWISESYLHFFFLIIQITKLFLQLGIPVKFTDLLGSCCLFCYWVFSVLETTWQSLHSKVSHSEQAWSCPLLCPAYLSSPIVVQMVVWILYSCVHSLVGKLLTSSKGIEWFWLETKPRSSDYLSEAAFSRYFYQFQSSTQIFPSFIVVHWVLC